MARYPGENSSRTTWKLQMIGKNCKSVGILIILSFLCMDHFLNVPDERRLSAEEENEDENEVAKPWICTWSPAGSNEECDQMLSKRLPSPTIYKMKKMDQQEVERRRFLLFGDSTMGRLFVMSPLRLLLRPHSGRGECPMEDIVCSEKSEIADHRCSMHETFGLNKTLSWIKPEPTRHEGPISYGRDNPYCKDCGSCVSLFPDCFHQPPPPPDNALLPKSDQPQCINNRQIYGGYFTMNYARDVELQTPDFPTTQENYVAYLNRKWNTPSLIESWGKPICIMSAGIHDMIIRYHQIRSGKVHGFVVRAQYQENLKWLLTLFQPVCDHIIWLGNTANGHEKNNIMYPLPAVKIQTMESMKQMDTDVKEVIQANPQFHNLVSFIDVHEASLLHPHDDFIHLTPEWYGHFGNWFLSWM
jgi:hypothetical protein